MVEDEMDPPMHYITEKWCMMLGVLVGGFGQTQNQTK